MKIRDFSYEKDALAVDEIFRRQPDISVPSLNHVYNNIVIENGDGRFLAYGVVKEFAEAVLILDHNSNKREKAGAVKLAIAEAIMTCKKHNLERLMLITSHEGFVKVLKHRYGFDELKGTLLYLELGE